MRRIGMMNRWSMLSVVVLLVGCSPTSGGADNVKGQLDGGETSLSDTEVSQDDVGSHDAALEVAEDSASLDLEELQDNGVSEVTSDLPSVLPDCPAGKGVGEQFKDLAYATVHERNRLDLYLPSDDGPVPVIVWVHGGGWKAGDKAQVPSFVLPFLKRGYAVCSVNYRLSDHDWPAPIADVKAAIRWLRLNAETYGLAPDKIGAWGSSAGGHLVALLGVTAGEKTLDDPEHADLDQSSEVQAVVDYYGPAEFLTMDEDVVANGCPNNALCHLCQGSPEETLVDCGAALTQCPDKAASASPITYVDAADSPFLVVHGSDDCTVPTPQSERMHAALTQSGVDSIYIEVPGAGHNKGEVSTPEVLMAAYQLLDRELRGCVTVDTPTDPKPGNPPPAYENVDACQLAQCPAQYQACQELAGCIDVEACFRECLKEARGGCVAKCASDLNTELAETHKALFFCAKPHGCYELP